MANVWINVLAELDDLIARDEERQDFCSETGPNEAMNRVIALQKVRNCIAGLINASAGVVEVVPGAGDEEDRYLRDLNSALIRCRGF